MPVAGRTHRRPEGFDKHTDKPLHFLKIVRTTKMARKILIAASLCVAVLMTYQVNSAAEKKSPLKGVNCFLKKTKDGKPIPVKASNGVAYKGATVYWS